MPVVCKTVKPLPPMPALLAPWLYASGSLTQQLTELSHGLFHVLPVQEHYRKLSLTDSRWLGVPSHELAWVRESLLYGDGTAPWVKAISYFPMRSLKGDARRFLHLGKRPIGHLLFKRTIPQCERRVLYLANQGWTRQSCYTWHGRKLIVQETFLPAFIDYLQQH